MADSGVSALTAGIITKIKFLSNTKKHPETMKLHTSVKCAARLLVRSQRDVAARNNSDYLDGHNRGMRLAAWLAINAFTMGARRAALKALGKYIREYIQANPAR